jgi:hypothetical protein
MTIARDHKASDNPARPRSGHVLPRRLLPALLLLGLLLPARGICAGAVDLSQLPPHPRFFLTNAVLPTIRSEIASGNKKTMYNEIKSRANGYLASSPSVNVYAVLTLALVGKVESNATYTQKAVDFFMFAVNAGSWDKEIIEWPIAYDWLYESLTPAQRTAARTVALPAYVPGQQRTVYYNLESLFATTHGLAGMAFYGEGSAAENDKCQLLVDEWDGRMRGVGKYAYPGGSAASKGGVLPTRQLYYPDGGYYKGMEYAQIDMEGIACYLALFQDLGLGNYWDLCGTFIDNWPQYLLYMTRPDGYSQRLMSGTTYSIITRGYQGLALIASHRDNPYAAWLVDNAFWGSSQGGYEWAIMCAVWRTGVAQAAPSTLPLTKFYGADGKDNMPGTSWSEKVILRTGWNMNGANDDAYFTLHAGSYFGDYWNFYQLAFEIYYKGALAIRSGFYKSGDAFLKSYNSRAVAANCVVVLDERQAERSDRWGQDYLYAPPGPQPPQHIYDVANDNAYDTADILFYEEKPLEDGVSQYVKGALNPAAAYTYTNGTRHVALQTREVAALGRYFVIRDKVIQEGDNNSVRFLLHTINRPTVEATPTSSQVPDHIVIYPRARYTAVRSEILTREGGLPPIQYAGKIWCVPVIPQDATLRVVGGTGYEFWVDDGSGVGVNTPIEGSYFQNPSDFTDATEAGQWRVETIAPSAGTVDFVHAIYVGPVMGTMPEVRAVDTPSAVGCEITGQGVFIFGRSEEGETGIDYEITGELLHAPQLIEGLLPGIDYAIRIGDEEPLTSRSSKSGGLTFYASGPAHIRIEPANLAAR